MAELHCSHCGRELEAKAGAAFCPYCGNAVHPVEKREEEPPEALEYVRKAEALQDPRKKWELLKKAEEQYPDSLAIARELLFLGKLPERNPKKLDFSVIKSHLWMMYLKPQEFTQEKISQMREELFTHPQLARCMELSPNPDAFLRAYLTQLGLEFIRLFLRGDSVYMRRFFGLGMDSRAPKLLADPVGYMLSNIRQDKELTESQRQLLSQSLYEAFAKDMAGDTKWLDEALGKAGIARPIKDREY